MRLNTRPRRQSDDGIVPLINIVFLLLIFFLIAGTITPRADISIDFPQTAESPGARMPADAVYVSAGGFISYRGARVDADGLAATVAAEIAAQHGSSLAVVVDRSLPAADLSPVLGALAGAGATKVRLITKRRIGS
jgi:biopolymer transport protein ExbD